MQMLEGNLFSVCGHQCTVEFQPSADQSWKSWANNELNQAATYPSPYANVHKGDMSKMGGSIGYLPSDTWAPPNQEKQLEEVAKLDGFRKTLASNLSSSQVHVREMSTRYSLIQDCTIIKFQKFSTRYEPCRACTIIKI